MNKFYDQYQCLPQKKTLMCWQTRFIQLLLNHMKLLALCESRFVRKITFGGILSWQAFEKRLADLGEKPLKKKQEEDWEAQNLALSYFKTAVRRVKRDL